jgi:hypothetical protein
MFTEPPWLQKYHHMPRPGKTAPDSKTESENIEGTREPHSSACFKMFNGSLDHLRKRHVTYLLQKIMCHVAARAKLSLVKSAQKINDKHREMLSSHSPVEVLKFKKAHL